MASRTSKPTKAIPLAEFANAIEQRAAAAGVSAMPRNSGDRRTPSKRALLKAIEDAGGKW